MKTDNCRQVTTRRATSRRRNVNDIVQASWGQATSWFPSVESIAAEEVELIHTSALEILEELGIRCLVPEAQNYFAAAGAIVDRSSGLIKVGREIVEAGLFANGSQLSRADSLHHSDGRCSMNKGW